MIGVLYPPKGRLTFIMRILMFSITPLFPAHDMGGGQKHLRTIAMHLAGLGHDITILCTRRADTKMPFRWHERILVKPILAFRQPFPGPYDVPAYDIAAIVQDVAEHLTDADRFYIHDGEFIFTHMHQHVPTVVSLRDNVYPETTQGAFFFQAHRLIVISEYARQFFLHTAGRFSPGLADRMTVIHNSIDWSRFKPTPPAAILDILKVDPDRHAVVLHPHRPEDSKGIWQTLEVADRLVHRYGIDTLRVCVPLWLGVQHDPGVSAYYDRVRAEVARRGLTEHIVFHDWIPAALMPEYYSAGRVTLALGSFVESFGNTVYESLGCGTPSIAARISSHRELLPEGLSDKVDFNDHETAAALAADIITTGRKPQQAALDYLHAHYRIEDQLNRYAGAILNAEIAPPLPYTFTPITEATRWQPGIWCYLAPGRGVYHDYKADYLPDAALMALMERGTPFTAADATPAQIEAWYRAGYIVPLSS